MKLIKLKAGRYCALDGQKRVEGDLNSVTDYLEACGVAPEEIAFALSQMTSNQHDTAVFGVNKIFTHTSDAIAVRSVRLELEAIKALRREFHDAYREDPTSQETRDANKRLMSLYFALNVEAALAAIGEQPRLAA